ncbi:hypothetical protein ACFV4Q_02790 [Streptomyces nojiriensis]|uniref:hypothetical protein n=1 Tax=Streptomyces nojiriensis TaxID=66374 RepID=UPI003661B4A8
MSFFSGGVTGGVGDGQGWVLLPASCTRSLPALIEGHAPERSDPVELARLLTDVANRPGADGGSGKARETVQEGTGLAWACEVMGRATYAVTREPQILAAIAASPGYAQQRQVAGLRVSGFDTEHVVTGCSGTPTYFSLELGRSYTSALGAPGMPTPDELFKSFLEVVGKRYGCSADTP